MTVGQVILPGGSEFRPNHLSNVWCWFRADLGVSGSPTITNWADQGPNGYDLSNISGDPQINLTGGPNNHAIVEFDATDDRANQATVTDAVMNTHMFLIARVGTYVNGDILVHLGQDSPTTKPYFIMNASSQVDSRCNDGSNKVATMTASPSAGTFALFEQVIRQGSVVTGKVNNGTEVTTAIGTASAPDGIAFGAQGGVATGHGDVDIAEFVLYESGEKTGNARDALIQYFSDRYGLF